ncbi:MAG: cisplatin damage response ATP-dependent DNA ligase [Pseudomonadota bacterium]
MKAFATLLDALSYQPQRNAKLRLLIDYFNATPDPDRGWALTALTGGLSFAQAKPALIRSLIAERTDETLFALSYDYVGDLAETVSLLWPGGQADAAPSLSEVIAGLEEGTRASLPGLLTRWLDRLDPTGRWALLKLITGGLRVGVSARLAKTALATFGERDVNEIEELWHGLTPPYTELFAWLEGRADKPEHALNATFRPVMLAHPLEASDYALITPSDYAAEWKWDGIRVQAVSEKGTRRLYSRTGEEISHTFPDIVSVLPDGIALDGELLVKVDGEVGSFSDLQKRLNRKTVSVKLLASAPGLIRAYDLLMEDGEDLRPLPFAARRARLEAWYERTQPLRIDLSGLVPFDDFSSLTEARARSADDPSLAGVEGLMLKRKDSAYVPGRPKGPWFKWKRDPFLIDAVLLYAQRGHGKRSSFYSDYTFGVWTETDEGPGLVPVGKAYFGFTDEELGEIDKFVRHHTTSRFGPVREVVHTPEEGLVFEVAFEGLQHSTRHKSGLAMRFPRIHRLRWDKPPREADHLDTLKALLDGKGKTV